MYLLLFRLLTAKAALELTETQYKELQASYDELQAQSLQRLNQTHQDLEDKEQVYSQSPFGYIGQWLTAVVFKCSSKHKTRPGTCISLFPKHGLHTRYFKT